MKLGIIVHLEYRGSPIRFFLNITIDGIIKIESLSLLVHTSHASAGRVRDIKIVTKKSSNNNFSLCLTFCWLVCFHKRDLKT